MNPLELKKTGLSRFLEMEAEAIRINEEMNRGG